MITIEKELEKTFENEMTLSEENFQKLFARSIKLGEDTSGCLAPEDLAGAIPAIWDKLLEVETFEKLFLTPLISSSILNTGIVEKVGLEGGPGDILWISKVDQLDPAGGGLLGATHLIEGDETDLSLNYVSFAPVRYGAGVCWKKGTARMSAFDLKQTARTLLAGWSAKRIEQLIISAISLATRVIFSPPATSLADINPTDTFSSSDILSAYVSLLATSTLPITQLGDQFLLLLHPLVYADLMRDSLFVTTVAQSSAAGVTFDLKGFLASYSQCRIAVTPLMPVDTSEGSPGANVYTSALIGSRGLGIGFGQKPKMLEKISSYGELGGVGEDFYCEAKILNDEHIVLIKSSATPVPA